MIFREQRLTIAIIILSGLFCAGVGEAANTEPTQETSPPEGEVGTRALPMQPQVFQSPKASSMAATPSSPYPAACVKFNPTGLSQPIPATHYFSTTPVMPVVNRNSFGSSSPSAGWIVSPSVYAIENPNPTQYEGIGAPELHLPHGAIIREVSILVRDNSGKQNLQAELLQDVGIGQPGGWIPLRLESDCLALGAQSKIGANNLAIPVDGRKAHRIQLGLVPAQVPLPSPNGAAIGVDIITIGYTMP